jgi:hypothetical protein
MANMTCSLLLAPCHTQLLQIAKLRILKVSSGFTSHAQQDSSEGLPTRFPSLLQESEHVDGVKGLVNMRIPVEDVVQADCAHAE